MTQTAIQKKSLKELRKESLLSQADVADILGVSQATVSRFESGVQVPERGQRQTLRELYDTELHGTSGVQWIDKNQLDLKWLRHTNPNDPRRTLRWWRDHRHLSVEELAELSGLSPKTINNWEKGAVLTMRPKNRRALAKALMIAPDKLVLPGDEEKLSPGFTDRTANLRAELRGARHALRLAYDILREDAAITHRWQQSRDDVMPEIVRELKGT
jgi:transcriptional regulator with XRE-family HTH domain